MGKFGWDLPPGCSVNDIPGNTQEDAELEAIELAFYDTLSKKEWDEIETHCDIIWKAIEYGMEVGKELYKIAQQENAYYEQQAKEWEAQNGQK